MFVGVGGLYRGHNTSPFPQHTHKDHVFSLFFSHAFFTKLYLERAGIQAEATHGTRGRVGVSFDTFKSEEASILWGAGVGREGRRGG